jgi:hypothetical protein
VYDAAWHVSDYPDFDEGHALATKAVRGLGGTPGDEAEKALIQLASAGSEIMRDAAKTQLKCRSAR